MGSHSCNALCDLDERFHKIQKYEGSYDAWYASTSEMRAFLLHKIKEYFELLSLLEQAQHNKER